MSLKTDLFSFLTTTPALSAVIGARLYPVTLPQNVTLPAATYLQVSTVPAWAHDGPTGWERARFQFDLYAATPLAVEAAADALRTALANWRAASHKYAGFEESRQDLPEPERGLYRISLDAFINRME